MQRHSMDKGVFIRSLATRGHFGGLTQSTRSAIDVLDAMGKDYILVETVGVGQDEVDVVRSAHTTVIVVIPGMGDGIQAIKAGILEVGDIFLINKADRDGSDKTYTDLKLMIEMDDKKYDRGTWKPPILKAQAVFDEGVTEFMEAIENHAQYLKGIFGGLDIRKHKGMVRQELAEMIKARLLEEVLSKLTETGDFEKAVQAISDGKIDPYSACDNLVLPIVGLSHP